MNRYKNHRRQRQRRPELVEWIEAPASGRNPFDDLDLSERRRRQNEYLSKLSDDQQEVIALKYGANLDFAQIAEIVACRQATVRSCMSLGIARLRKQRLGLSLPDQERICEIVKTRFAQVLERFGA